MGEKIAVLFGVELEKKPGVWRNVCLLPTGRMALSSMQENAKTVSTELEWDMAKVIDIATNILAGNERAVTEPGALRILAASLLFEGYQKGLFEEGAKGDRSEQRPGEKPAPAQDRAKPEQPTSDKP